MRFLWNRFLRRFTFIGRIADFFLMAGIALRFGHRQGWVSDDLMRSVGLDSAVQDKQAAGATGSPAGLGEIALGAGAAWRLLRRRMGRRRLR